MKSIVLFRILVIISAAVFFPAVFAGAETGKDRFPYTVSVSPSAGLLVGQNEEILYYPDEDRKLSQLLWKSAPMYYSGMTVNFSRKNPMERRGFFSDVSLKFGLPGRTGNMEDRDWQAANYSDLTNFSTHDNYMKGAFFLDISAGLSFPVKSWFVIKPFTNFSLMYFSWTAKDGYAQYAREIAPFSNIYEPWTDSLEKRHLNGALINYTQIWLLASPGISCFVPLNRYFSEEFSFLMSPLIFCKDLDEHLLRSFETRDSMLGGLYFEPRFTFTFKPIERLMISLTVSYRDISGTKGNTYYRNTTDGLGSPGDESYTLHKNKAGAGLSFLEAGLGLKVQF
jgi:outer membrane protease